MKKRNKFLLLPLITAMLAALSGCNSHSAADMNKTEFFAMDTYMSISASGENSEVALSNARREIKALESLLSVTDENSEITRINHSGGKETEISEDTAAVINFALYLGAATDGALDITMYPLVKEWGFTTGEYKIPDSGRIEELLKNTGYDEIYYGDNIISLPAGFEIDLGALGKGFAGDRAVAVLKEKGIESALLNLGGNIQAIGGRPDGSPWNIGVQNPFGEGNALTVKISDKAVVTSGNYERYFEENGKRYCHIIDPKTGCPAESGIASVTVIGSSGLACDGLSTALFVMGEEKAIYFWRQQSDFDMIIITEDRRVLVTEGVYEDCSGSEGNELERIEKL